jgi:hypothetical protein
VQLSLSSLSSLCVCINALCVHQRLVLRVCAFVWCTHCHVHPQGSRHTSDLDWSKLYGDMDPHGTYVKVRVYVCVCAAVVHPSCSIRDRGIA